MYRLGRTGEAFIVSKEGFYQTRSRTGGQVMDQVKPKTLDLSFFEGVKFWRVKDEAGREVLRAKAWMKNNTWLLVVQQDVDDAFGELYATRNMAIFIFILGACLIGVVTLFTTRMLVRKIELLDRAKKGLDEQLIQSQKLASIGELSAGIAHEINNPLAVIGEEAGWMQDLLKTGQPEGSEGTGDFKDSLREISQQAGRCKEITHKLLSFARKMESVIKDVDLNKLLDEVIAMRERDANYSNIAFSPEIPEKPAHDLQRPLPTAPGHPEPDQQRHGRHSKGRGDYRGDGDRRRRLRGDTGQGYRHGDSGGKLEQDFRPFFYHQAPGQGNRPGAVHLPWDHREIGGEHLCGQPGGQGNDLYHQTPLRKRERSILR